jgi:hypothetical protein
MSEELLREMPRNPLRHATERLAEGLRPWLEKHKGSVQVIVPLSKGMIAHGLLKEHLGDLLPSSRRGIFYTVRVNKDYWRWPTLPYPLSTRDLFCAELKRGEAGKFSKSRIGGHEVLERTKEVEDLLDGRKRPIGFDELVAYLQRYRRLFKGRHFLILDDDALTGKTLGDIKKAFKQVFPRSEVVTAALGKDREATVDFAGYEYPPTELHAEMERLAREGEAELFGTEMRKLSFKLFPPEAVEGEVVYKAKHGPAYVLVKGKARSFIARVPDIKVSPGNMAAFKEEVRRILGKKAG